MPSRKALVGLLLIVGVVFAGYTAFVWSQPPTGKSPVFGVVRATEVKVAPEVGGILSTFEVKKGDYVHAGEVVAKLSAIELSASLAQARAVLAAAISDRNNVYAGVRTEQIAAYKAEVSKAKSKLEYAVLQLNRATYLAQNNDGTQQARDQAEDDAAAARNGVAQAEANYAAAIAGPTEAERAIADAQVGAATSAVSVLERRLEKMVLRAPVEGTVSVIVAEVGEAIRAGEPLLVIDRADRQWLSFNVREDRIHGLTVGDTIAVARLGRKDSIPAHVTELIPLGQFATWQAERAVGDHDLNTLQLRLDPTGNKSELKPGMTVSFAR